MKAMIIRAPGGLQRIEAREIADPGLRACLESLASKLESSAGAPALPSEPIDLNRPLRSIS